MNIKVHVGADDGVRTRDLHLGKVALYQLSYIHKQSQKLHSTIGSRIVLQPVLSKAAAPALTPNATLSKEVPSPMSSPQNFPDETPTVASNPTVTEPGADATKDGPDVSTPPAAVAAPTTDKHPYVAPESKKPRKFAKARAGMAALIFFAALLGGILGGVIGSSAGGYHPHRGGPVQAQPGGWKHQSGDRLRQREMNGGFVPNSNQGQEAQKHTWGKRSNNQAPGSTPQNGQPQNDQPSAGNEQSPDASTPAAPTTPGQPG